MKPRFVVKQRITALVNRYAVLSANSSQNMLAFAQQKRFKFKEKVLVYSDESRSNLEFTFRAEKVLDIHGKFIVESNDGQTLGYFQKQFKSSLLISTWKVFNIDDEELFTVRESSQTLAILRRFLGWIPYVGELASIVLLFFKYHFAFIDPKTGEEIGTYTKTTLLRDHYRLDMTDTAWESTDWRVIASMCVALDALQDR